MNYMGTSVMYNDVQYFEMTFLAQRLEEIPRLLKEITVCLVTHLLTHSFCYKVLRLMPQPESWAT